MLPSRAGRQQGKAGILCLTMLEFGHPRGRPSQPRELLSLSQTRSRHSQLGLELSRMQLSPPPMLLPQLQLAEARDDSVKIPLMTTTLELSLTPYCPVAIQRSLRKKPSYILSHAGHLSQGFALASGLVSPRLPFIALSLHVGIRQPDRLQPGQSGGPNPSSGLLFCFLSSR